MQQSDEPSRRKTKQFETNSNPYDTQAESKRQSNTRPRTAPQPQDISIPGTIAKLLLQGRQALLKRCNLQRSLTAMVAEAGSRQRSDSRLGGEGAQRRIIQSDNRPRDVRRDRLFIRHRQQEQRLLCSNGSNCRSAAHTGEGRP